MFFYLPVTTFSHVEFGNLVEVFRAICGNHYRVLSRAYIDEIDQCIMAALEFYHGRTMINPMQIASHYISMLSRLNKLDSIQIHPWQSNLNME